MNKLNAANLTVIVKEIVDVYGRNSRNEVSTVITGFVLDACIGHESTLKHLLGVYAGGIAVRVALTLIILPLAPGPWSEPLSVAQRHLVLLLILVILRSISINIINIIWVGFLTCSVCHTTTTTTTTYQPNPTNSALSRRRRCTTWSGWR